MDLNEVTLMGNVGQDPETFETKAGKKIVRLSVATNRSWKDKDGEKKQVTQWHRVVFFNEHLALLCEKFVSKGSRVMIRGRIEYEKYTDKSGTEKWATNIVVPPYEGMLSLEGGGRGSDDDGGMRSREMSEDEVW